ncbi:creatininase family protein [Flammeovirga aprica]|uniref:Creatininase family protein n=1 Tax=Flammeovirga aprica JL-4 TaxID=694437 RepID=A0A7X9P150_9BACT|nr:creatininase family protein [Flammeovirga aprica]NME67525.1 creatininase family protein [Flammeovirga aprica JL-4]
MKNRPYILAECHWETLQHADFEVAILPWGATEAHNYHLPYATDNIQVDAIAAEAAKFAWENGAKVIVLPTIPLGVNTGQTDIYLDMNIYPSTQKAILNDTIEVLNRHSIKKLLILNGHGGNDFKTMIRELGVKYPEMLVCASSWFQVLDRNKYFDQPGDHADEVETSLILHLAPELVLPQEKWGKGTEKRNKIEAFNEGWVWTERKWSEISEDTGTGNPALATREKGENFFKAVTKKLGEFLCELDQVDRKEMYK